MSHQKTIRIIILALFAVIAGTWIAVKQTTDRLLYQDATSTARKWAHQLAEGVADLEQIAAGEEPSAASMTFFRWSQLIGVVFRYEIFNREGYSQLMSDRRRTGPVDVSEFSEAAARAVRTGEPIVAVRESEAPDLPAFFAEAYVPVTVQGRTIAVVAASVDQTEERERYTKTFVVAAISLCLLTALAFILPATAWHRRTNEKRLADAEIMFLATHDGMTRLANRGHFSQALAHALDQLGEGRLAIHYIDLDRFKEVNDTLGRQGGDALLRLAAERIRASTRAEDVVARLGGDEFAVLQPHLADRGQAESLAYRILGILAEPFVINGHEATISTSIGIAVAPEDGLEAERLLSSADLALYHSKADGRGRVGFFTSDMDAELQERLRLERCIREALRDDGFQLHFQPLVDMADGNVVGFEALLRLKDADGRPIPPMTFIPIAEEMRLIAKIGTWVIRQVLPYRGAVAAPPLDRGQPVGGAIRGRRRHRDRLRRAGGRSIATSPPAAGNHRKPAVTRRGRHHARAAADQSPGRGHRDGRFRNRVFESELFVAFPIRQNQDRPRFSPELERGEPRSRDDRQNHGGPRAFAADAGDDRGRRERRSGRVRPRYRLRRGSGVLLWPSDAGQRFAGAEYHRRATDATDEAEPRTRTIAKHQIIRLIRPAASAGFRSPAVRPEARALLVFY
jgi:diguanylate cyclase (GGDEF)-like protein